MKVADITHIRPELEKIASYHGVKYCDINDIVQETFLKLCEIQRKEGNIDRITYKGKINMVYIFNMIRNAAYTKYKKDARMVLHANIGGISEDTDTQLTTPLANEIETILRSDKNGAFYHKLYHAYFNDKISLRKLSAKTDISVQTLFQGVKYIKQQIKAVL